MIRFFACFQRAQPLAQQTGRAVVVVVHLENPTSARSRRWKLILQVLKKIIQNKNEKKSQEENFLRWSSMETFLRILPSARPFFFLWCLGAAWSGDARRLRGLLGSGSAEDMREGGEKTLPDSGTLTCDVHVRL